MATAVIAGLSFSYIPLMGWLLINSKTHFTVPLTNFDYKPWRLFFFALGLPSFICGIVMLLLPESPKFLFSKGDEEGALNILRRVYGINNGGDGKYSVTRILEDPDFNVEATCADRDEPSNSFLFMWHQILQLVSKKFIWKTMITLLLQFSIFGSSQSLYVFFPELINPLVQHSLEEDGESLTMCEVYENHRKNVTFFVDEQDLVSRLLNLKFILIGVFNFLATRTVHGNS
jgi:VNT family MFS transporter (synaptic vesicle glycoprotein 2)